MLMRPAATLTPVTKTHSAGRVWLVAFSLLCLALAAPATSVWAQERTRAGIDDVAAALAIAEARGGGGGGAGGGSRVAGCAGGVAGCTGGVTGCTG